MQQKEQIDTQQKYENLNLKKTNSKYNNFPKLLKTVNISNQNWF